MTDRLAVILGLLLILFFGADMAFNGGEITINLARKFMALLDYIEFWR